MVKYCSRCVIAENKQWAPSAQFALMKGAMPDSDRFQT
jgi:hypothetical protein